MSRSKKHNPIVGNACCRSEKHDKRIANRALRSRVRDAIVTGAEVLPELREVSDVWTMGKDGKQHLSPAAVARNPKLVRK